MKYRFWIYGMIAGFLIAGFLVVDRAVVRIPSNTFPRGKAAPFRPALPGARPATRAAPDPSGGFLDRVEPEPAPEPPPDVLPAEPVPKGERIPPYDVGEIVSGETLRLVLDVSADRVNVAAPSGIAASPYRQRPIETLRGGRWAYGYRIEDAAGSVLYESRFLAGGEVLSVGGGPGRPSRVAFVEGETAIEVPWFPSAERIVFFRDGKEGAMGEHVVLR